MARRSPGKKSGTAEVARLCLFVRQRRVFVLRRADCSAARQLFGASGPVPRGTFPSPEKYPTLAGKVPKRAHREGTLSMGSLPYVPLPHDDTKGAHPLWNPPSQSCGLSGDPYEFHLRGGNESRLAPRFSPLAKTLVRRTPGESPNETCPSLTGRQAKYRR